MVVILVVVGRVIYFLLLLLLPLYPILCIQYTLYTLPPEIPRSKVNPALDRTLPICWIAQPNPLRGVRSTSRLSGRRGYLLIFMLYRCLLIVS
jgi:hypothetical protein